MTAGLPAWHTTRRWCGFTDRPQTERPPTLAQIYLMHAVSVWTGARFSEVPGSPYCLVELTLLTGKS